MNSPKNSDYKEDRVQHDDVIQAAVARFQEFERMDSTENSFFEEDRVQRDNAVQTAVTRYHAFEEMERKKLESGFCPNCEKRIWDTEAEQPKKTMRCHTCFRQICEDCVYKADYSVALGEHCCSERCYNINRSSRTALIAAGEFLAFAAKAAVFVIGAIFLLALFIIAAMLGGG